MPAKNNEENALFQVRGGAIADLVIQEDLGAGTASFQVDTRIDKRLGRGGNEKEYDKFIAKLRAGKYKNDQKILKTMIAFLDREVDAFGKPLSDSIKAKNMFRAAFGLPPLSAADEVASNGG